MGYLVRHIMIDLYGCPSEHLDDPALLEQILTELCDILHTDIRAKTSYQFEPHGVTSMMVVGASHLSIHTWPESNYACVDVVVCTDNFKTTDVIAHIEKRLEATSNNVTEIRRGLME
ncbi:MAG: adenosylmethionine decarboxylase [Anaerolineaceae bacterium]|nr:adenosylmethionine decarboxylase [Anaerolineaceae bacterium]